MHVLIQIQEYLLMLTHRIVINPLLIGRLDLLNLNNETLFLSLISMCIYRQKYQLTLTQLITQPIDTKILPNLNELRKSIKFMKEIKLDINLT